MLRRFFNYALLIVLVCITILTAGCSDKRGRERNEMKSKFYSFDFGEGRTANGYVKVTSKDRYKRSLGYGFVNSKVQSGGRTDSAKLFEDYCTGESNFSFRVDLPNGEYKVTVTAGDASTAQEAMSVKVGDSVKVQNASAPAGKFICESFYVGVSDGQITLDFSGKWPKVNAIEISPLLKFDFGPGRTEPGYIQVLQTTAYDAGKGYGFLDISKVTSKSYGSSDALQEDNCSFRGTSFVVDVPNGDYMVKITLGDQEAETSADIKIGGIVRASDVKAQAGKSVTQLFNVAVIDGKMTLEIEGDNPYINAMVMEKFSNRLPGEKPTVYLAGDSTVMTYNSNYYPQAGWGQMIAKYFTQDVLFANRAIGGRSSKSFFNEGRLDSILNEIRPGDYMFIQFGHNDASVSRPERYIDPAGYREYLRKYIAGSRQRNATPVLVTPMGRYSLDENGKFKTDFPDYVNSMKQVAVEEKVALIDLCSKSIDLYNSLGPEATKGLFLMLEKGVYPNFPDGADDHTHFQEKGADQLARLVAEGVKELNLPISQYVK